MAHPWLLLVPRASELLSLSCSMAEALLSHPCLQHWIAQKLSQRGLLGMSPCQMQGLMSSGTRCYLQVGDYMFIINMPLVQGSQEPVSLCAHSGTGTGLSCLLPFKIFNDFFFTWMVSELLPMGSSHISPSENECTKASGENKKYSRF